MGRAKLNSRVQTRVFLADSGNTLRSKVPLSLPRQEGPAMPTETLVPHLVGEIPRGVTPPAEHPPPSPTAAVSEFRL